ncbi:MAG: C10 family peptidase, partial [Kiritimatiellae bacterium]|nr:C10 family peptidase [Kiritimatiellia bacterium]
MKTTKTRPTLMSRARTASASFAAALFAAFTASADPVTTNDVVDAVAGWINLGESLGGGFAAQPESVRTYTANGGSANYHVVSFAGGGYVVTSGDTALKPVLAYSNTGTWIDDEAKNPLMAMLNIDVAAAMAAEQSSASASATTQKSGLRLSASAAGTTASTQQQDAKAAEWAKLIAAKSSSSSTKGGRRLAAAAPTTDLRVAPLMTTAWNQSYVGSSKKCYNYYTPCNYVCGCTATAMAQVMKYHRYPTGKVTAAHDYFSNVIYSDGGSVVTNGWNLSDGYYASATASSKTKWEPAFGGPYDWDAMVDSPDGSESEAARQAIGLLCRDAAISVFSTFSSGGTAGHGASIASALLDTFGFAGATTTYYNENTLLASLDANLPALFWIANSKYAHEVVADGYGYDSTSTIYVHFNMGWGSVGSDTWYTPPSSIGDYTSVTRMVTGIFTPAQGAPGSSVISGRVLDTDGDPISGATVTVTTDDGTVVATTNSNDKGIYAFILPAGTYNFTATVDSNKGVNRCAVLASTQVTYPTDGYGEGVSNSRSGVNLVVGPDRFVEYVEAADGQYFDTGVIGKPGTKFQTRFMLAPKYVSGKSLIGSYGNSADFWMKFDLDACLNNKFGTTYKYQWLAADVVYEASCECTADNKVVLVIDDADGVNKVNWNLTSTLSDTDKSMYYFARNDNGTANGHCPGRCYGLTIWQVPDGGTDYVLVRNFIPCVRDGRPGLYDAVSREMFYSLAGGDFTPGPAVDTVVLEEDADWTADGAKSYDVPTVIDLNGYTLTVSSLTASSYGVNVVNRSDTPATLVGGIDTDKVVVGGNMTVKLAELTHRWSFNGTSDTENLVDSVGRVTATKLGSKIAYKDGEAVCSGYGSGTGSFNLGENLLDTERATIEIWATLRVASSWARIFDYGPSSSGGYLTLTWSYGKDLAYPKAIVNYSGDKYNQNAFSSAFVTGRRYHISCTVKANGDGSATVRWMRRNAETGVLDGSGSCTQADWTLAKMVNPKLLLGKSQWGDMDAVASYDEVRVWKGILSDEQLAANAVTSPDTVLEPVVAGFAAGAGGIVRVGEPAASVFPGTLDLSSGAKIVFDTASFGGASASFTAYGFTLPAGAANVLDCVELTDAAHYVATLNGSTISVAANASFDATPVTAEWKGGTPTAESLALASSWTCLNAAGVAITAVPGPETTVIIPVGDTTFTIPSGYTPNWGAIQFGGASATRWARRNYNEARSDIAGVWTDSSAWKDMPLADYSTDNGTLAEFGDFDGSKISRSQVRLDGWFYVSPEQRGVWRFTSTNFDDYLALLVDGEDVVVVNTYGDTNTAGERRLAAGWHRFTLVVGDTAGGASNAINQNALAVSVNGAAAVAFSSLTFGTETGTVKLQADCDLSALGDIALSSGTEVDLNGYSLNLKGVSSDYLGMKFTNSSATSSTLYTESGKVGTGVLTENITVRAPDGFVEYVEAADGQYFDTGVIGKPGTKFQTKFMLAPKSEANKALIGSSGNSADFWLKFDYDACLNNKFGSWYAYTWLTADVVYETRCECTAGNKVVIVLDDADGVNKINWNATSTMPNTGKSMYYFARNNNGTANGLCPGRCYGLTIWQVPDGGTDYVLVRNFIPCVRDGRPGLYDAVSHEMFYSLADGDFTPGPAVTPVELTHRWSFTSDYSDSVGTADAENPVGSGVSLSDGRAVLAGGNNAGYLDLGTGVLGNGDATLEMWFEKLGSPASWAYAFSYAADDSSNDNMFALSTAWGWNSNSDTDTGVSIVPVYMNIGGTWYGTTSSGASTTYTLAYLLPNLPQHISVTFKTNSDGSTTVRWMSRDAATGFLLKECSNTIPSWTLADASAFRLLLGRNPYGWSTVHTLNSQFDEVRVWNGVLTDEQLSANVLTGPDATFTDGIVAGFDGMVLAPGETFDVNGTTGGYGYWTDKCVALRTGAKIRFNTADYFGTGLRFRAGGFVLPVGETDLLSFVELDDTENYTASLEDANTILVQLKDAIPHTSTWTGSTPSSAADLSNAANWTSVNAKGATVTAAPTAKTTAVIPAENLATFTLPG